LRHPENKFGAFELAAQLGADGTECDVQQCCGSSNKKKAVGTHWTGTHEFKSFDVRVDSIDSVGNATVRVFWEVEMRRRQNLTFRIAIARTPGRARTGGHLAKVIPLREDPAPRVAKLVSDTSSQPFPRPLDVHRSPWQSATPVHRHRSTQTRPAPSPHKTHCFHISTNQLRYA
jgi:hypothetical protein